MRIIMLEDKQSFDKMWDTTLKSELDTLNNYLDKWGFEVVLVDDYEDEDAEVFQNSVGIFCNEMQDCASVFPVFINKDMIYHWLQEEGYEEDLNEIKYAIRGTLWHEAGHGIINYLWGYWEFDDEEEVAEEFARYPDTSALIDALTEYCNDEGI